ncbi:DUF2059 domain-containing protein [Sphingosinicella microcystinivorans]|uniref:Uncharacterized protein DUF2059 n=1 Tax=Sphingosinicella microcystinivorans TaxID=335406 RepID=A0AAD1FZH2_SPHMI|nr:DUF2059 domain-containing protein [Sphingosinicella microcystinivorans]RKS88730.1 uncharacterized protein DUF2059 [Sphingosinicella microcystinivorans]BBE32486.1 hypothetical protein SmB9_01440 [Sphingosinicella microcystinivorans]
MKTRLFALATALMLAAPPAHAAEPDRAAQLVTLMGVEAKLDEVFSTLAPMFGTQVVAQLETDQGTSGTVRNLIENGRGGRDRLQKILSEEFLAELRKTYPAMIADFTSAYRNALSPGELDAAITFLKSPAGQKFVAAEKQTQASMKAIGERAGMTAGMAAVSNGFARAQREMLDEMK